jgi:DNA (cytosine-5)-methyltransferase 1
MMERLGYSVAVGNLHAEQYGVPQTRTRAVLIASLDREVSLPTPTHTRYRTGHVKVSGMPYTDLDRKPWVPMAQALNINSPAPGAYLRSNYGTGGVAANRGKRTLYQPAPTVTRKYNRNKWMLNGEVLGALTERQASLLQTFPADYPWQGRADERQLQLGNAIPPLLAKAILQQVI